MARITLTYQAQQDLYAAWSYIAQNNPTAADKWSDAMGERYAMLAQHPHLGSPRPLLKKGVRCLPVGSYVVFYHEVKTGIEIIRILHSARDLAAIFHADE